MYPIQEQFKSDTLAQMNSGVARAGQIVGSFLEISHEIGVLNVRTGRASAEAVTSAVQRLLAASSPVEFFKVAASVMRPDMQVWNGYTEQLRGIAGKLASSPAAAAQPLALQADAAPVDLQGVASPAGLSEPAEVVESPVPAESADLIEQTLQAPAAALPGADESAAPVPDVPQAVQEVEEVVKNAANARPVMSAAAAAAPSLSKSALVAKAGVAKVSKVARKPVSPARKSAPAARVSSRAKKG